VSVSWLVTQFIVAAAHEAQAANRQTAVVETFFAWRANVLTIAMVRGAVMVPMAAMWMFGSMKPKRRCRRCF
jgi:hypothetical protein